MVRENGPIPDGGLIGIGKTGGGVSGFGRVNAAPTQSKQSDDCQP
jgi:hypothetical protein